MASCHLVCNSVRTWNVLEQFDTFVHGFVSIIHAMLQLFGVEIGQWVFHQAFMPSQPIRGGCPQVPEWLEISSKFLQLVILQTEYIKRFDCFRGAVSIWFRLGMQRFTKETF